MGERRALSNFPDTGFSDEILKLDRPRKLKDKHGLLLRRKCDSSALDERPAACDVTWTGVPMEGVGVDCMLIAGGQGPGNRHFLRSLYHCCSGSVKFTDRRAPYYAGKVIHTSAVISPIGT
jgi:hypothetical protein